MPPPRTAAGTALLIVWLVSLAGVPRISAEERSERFDRDPGWDGHNNRSMAFPPRQIRQDFGYSTTAHAGGKPGEIGGFVTPAGEPAYYAKKLPRTSFNDKLTASGTLISKGREYHALIGFFNSGSLNEWRTPNTIALRISGRGDVFYAWLEYCTQRWRAGGDEPQSFPTVRDPQTGRQQFKGFTQNVVHRWTLEYDPKANNGRGAVFASIDGVKAVCHLAEGHQSDGAFFNRFGILTVMKSADTGGEFWIDDVTINGDREDFSKDPGWDGFQNRRTYMSPIVRPRFDFGFSSTRFAGGADPGELGGQVFRGDCRFPEKMACYGDRLGELTLDKPLRASGKICLTRGVSDSTVLFGFYHSKDSMAVNPSQAQGLPRCFLGISTDGPSSQGFYFTPVYRLRNDGQAVATGKLPQIYPDSKPHDWSLEYSPTAADGRGAITVRLDQQKVKLALEPGHKTSGARFDRFGLVTTWIDGNSQTICLDDLKYTWKQE